MRNFLLSIFWLASLGNVIQLLIMLSACWILISGTYSFSELSLSVFILQVFPWLSWLQPLIISLLGGFGIWLLGVPVLMIAFLKFIAGTIIGSWAFSLAKQIPVKRASARRL